MKIAKRYKIIGDQNIGKKVDGELFKIGLMTNTDGPLYESPKNIAVFSPDRRLGEGDICWIEKGYLIPHSDSEQKFVYCSIFFPELREPYKSEHLPVLTLQYYEESGLPKELEKIIENLELEDIKNYL